MKSTNNEASQFVIILATGFHASESSSVTFFPQKNYLCKLLLIQCT